MSNQSISKQIINCLMKELYTIKCFNITIKFSLFRFKGYAD